MPQYLRKIVVSLGIASTCAMTLALVAGTSVAGATTRYRSGSVRNQLASTAHLSTSGTTSGPLGLTGPTVMASVVGLMALLAVGFIVVTLIRRRVTLC